MFLIYLRTQFHSFHAVWLGPSGHSRCQELSVYLRHSMGERSSDCDGLSVRREPFSGSNTVDRSKFGAELPDRSGY